VRFSVSLSLCVCVAAGVWQKRWFYLNNEFLIYKKDRKAASSDIKGAIDLSEVDTVAVSAKGDMDVVSE
jgi:hypothetical protein